MTAPVLGVPAGTKQAGQRVDMRVEQFDLAIETKGYLLLWERSNPCPCAPVSSNTEQPDPTCDMCNGSGFYYFGRSEAQDLDGYEFDELQQEMIDTTEGFIIRGLITSIVSKQDPVTVIGNWVEGSSNLTVRHGNKLGFYDKVTSLDSQIVYTEVVETDGTAVLATRYPSIEVNRLQSVDTIYLVDVDFTVEKGVVTFIAGKIPLTDLRLSIHYSCHPVWLIMEHPHAARVTSKKFKTADPSTPTGEAAQLPIQALVRYDFLPEPV